VTLSYTTFRDEQRLGVIRPAVREFEECTGHTVNLEAVPGYTEKFVQQGLAVFRKWLDQAFDQNSIAVEQALREATREANLLVEGGKTRPTFPE
jgi:hypothetical protein